MANRPKGYGMTAELANKKAAKYDPKLAEEVLEWMTLVLQDNGLDELADKLPTDVRNQKDFAMPLKDGIILCNVINTLEAGTVKKINKGKAPFAMMENVSQFLAGCEKLGCSKTDLFQTVDLYEYQNIPQVVNGIVALGRKAQKFYDGPALGPQEATENRREFDEDTLNAGKGIIGLQAGSNQGASQAGMNFGKTRAIID